MKKTILLLTIGFLLAAGCTKSPVLSSPPKDLPFQNDQIKIELINADVPVFTDIHFFDAQNGIGITRDGKVYKTTDGGKNWTVKFSDPTPDQPLLKIFFANNHTGYVVGGTNNCDHTGCTPPGGLILKTTDAGNSWQIIHQDKNATFIAMAENNHGALFVLADAKSNFLLKSAGMGTTWQTITLPDFDFVNIAFSADGSGFCTGQANNSGAASCLLRSDDNGATWSTSGHNFSTQPLYYSGDIRFKNGKGFCIVNNMAVYQTSNNGGHWTQIFSSNLAESYQIEPLTNKDYLIFGGQYSGGDFGRNYGVIHMTTDSGNSWNTLLFKHLGILSHPSFYSQKDGYVSNGNQLIKITVK